MATTAQVRPAAAAADGSMTTMNHSSFRRIPWQPLSPKSQILEHHPLALQRHHSRLDFLNSTHIFFAYTHHKNHPVISNLSRPGYSSPKVDGISSHPYLHKAGQGSNAMCCRQTLFTIEKVSTNTFFQFMKVSINTFSYKNHRGSLFSN